jgi:glucose-1-phosphate cytidylyltransferase
MKTVILAGGRGSRMGLETDIIPKPMITIGGIPILRHIMNYYSAFGLKDFVILGGYKFEIIEDYFKNQDAMDEAWNIELVDTGLDSPTGERLLRVEDLLQEPFMLTYGDGLGNIDLARVWGLDKTIVTITAVHPPGRFGTLHIEENTNKVISFNEKQRLGSEWVNGGFMRLSPKIFKYIEHNEMLEFEVFPRLVEEEELTAYKHKGWWCPMDTIRDKESLEKLWVLKRCPWRK